MSKGITINELKGFFTSEDIFITKILKQASFDFMLECVTNIQDSDAVKIKSS